jgi:hypothetical protein
MFIDLRMQFLGDDDAWHPTKKGITVSPSQWPEFIAAISQVEAHLSAETLAKPSRSHRDVRHR